MRGRASRGAFSVQWPGGNTEQMRSVKEAKVQVGCIELRMEANTHGVETTCAQVLWEGTAWQEEVATCEEERTERAWSGTWQEVSQSQNMHTIRL